MLPMLLLISCGSKHELAQFEQPSAASSGAENASDSGDKRFQEHQDSEFETEQETLLAKYIEKTIGVLERDFGSVYPVAYQYFAVMTYPELVATTQGEAS